MSVMEIFFLFIIIVILFFLILGVSSVKNNMSKNSGNEIFQRIADTMGLRFIKGGMFGHPRVLGEIDGIHVFAGVNKVFSDRGYINLFEFSARFNYSVRGKLRITTRKTNPPLEEYESDYEVVDSGDIDFDSAMETGYTESPDTAIAILTKDLRSKIMALAKNSDYARVSRYGIHIYNNKTEVSSPESVVDGIINLIDIAKLILSYSDYRSLHIDNVLKDPINKVKLNNLKVLVSNYPHDNEIEELLKGCFKCEDLSIQFEAAKNVRPEGLHHILDLLSKNKIIDHEIIIEAVRTFGDALFKESAPVLIDVYNYYHRKNMRLEILKTFRKFSDETLSPFLESLLDYTDDDIVDGAVDTLATCGNVQSVGKLLQLSGKSINPFFRNRINETVLQIQSRLGSVEKGWLSVSELKESDGALSIADAADEGALSISDSDKKNKYETRTDPYK